jgi:hypothetical protein
MRTCLLRAVVAWCNETVAVTLERGLINEGRDA